MKSKWFTKAFVLVVVSMFLLGSSAQAGLNPKGWFKGKKKGWEGESTPPGLSKKEKEKAEKEAKKAADAAQTA